MKISQVFANLRPHWPFLIIATVGAALLLANLGSGYLWADEGDTAVLASNILKSGLPKAWDGVTFMDSDFGARVNNQMIMVSSPWLQYYLAAESFRLFGENTFAARLPFALAGILLLIVVYRLVWRTTGDVRAALTATVLTICSVQFLLLCRQSRYYPVAMLLTCLMIDVFLRMTSGKRAASFAIVAVLLFHTHPIGLVAVFALGALTLFPPFSEQRRWFWLTIGPVLLLTVPWLAIAHTGYTENAALVRTVRDFFIRLAQYAVECGSVTPLVGLVALSLIVLLNIGRTREQLKPAESRLLIAVLAVVISSALAMAATQRTAALWVTGVRYTSAVIPLVAIAAGVLILRVSRSNNLVWLILLFVFAFTKFAQITPWTFWADKNPDPEKKLVALHVPTRPIDLFLPTEDMLFVRDLWRSNLGTVGQCIEFLRQNASRNDVIITNYESEPLYFHTKLAQGMKIMRQDVIYDVAKHFGLPDYVFGVDHARWIVWRFNWDDYLGIHWREVSDHLSAEGAQISDVAEIKETGWENRENIHFHRFAGNIYLFPQDTNLASAHIFRIDWPMEP